MKIQEENPAPGLKSLYQGGLGANYGIGIEGPLQNGLIKRARCFSTRGGGKGEKENISPAHAKSHREVGASGRCP